MVVAVEKAAKHRRTPRHWRVSRKPRRGGIFVATRPTKNTKLRRSGIGGSMSPLRGWLVSWDVRFLQIWRSYGACDDEGCPPSPRPSPPGEGEPFAALVANGRVSWFWRCGQNLQIRRTRRNVLKFQDTPHRAPSPGGEGRGEGGPKLYFAFPRRASLTSSPRRWACRGRRSRASGIPIPRSTSRSARSA